MPRALDDGHTPPSAVPRPSALMVKRLWMAVAWWCVAIVFAVGFGLFTAHDFMQKTAPPAFTALERFIGAPVGPGNTVAPEIMDEIVAKIGPVPEADAETGAIGVVQRAFRTGNLKPSSVRFTEWGPPLPYVYEGAVYWAVPFRYEAQVGFGQLRTDTATALVRNGGVARFLFVPYWNFSGGRGLN